MDPIPDIDAGRLSQILGARVRRVALIGEAGGYTSDVYRIWIDSDGSLPPSLVMKRAAQDEAKRRLASSFDSYGKESRFYRSLAGKTGIRTPRCYHNDEAGFLLLLEDLGAWPEADLSRGANRRQTLLAVSTIARLHAGFWQTRTADAFAPGFEAASHDMKSFALDRLNELPASPAVRFMRRYAADSLRFLNRFTGQPQVLAHMDFRLDNLRIREDELVLFDWGEHCLAPPGLDLACFMVTSTSPGKRRRREAEVLECYIATLQRNGVHDYSMAELCNSYRSAIPPAWYLAALVLTRGERKTGRLLAARCLAAVEDHLGFLEDFFFPGGAGR